MIIKSMTASFGGLENARLELEPGLNIIEAPNEAGKSTWCGFIRTMLYGIDTARRGKSGVLPDKKRFLPWGNYPMTGTMDISWRGGEVTLSRSGAAGKPMGACEATLSGTAQRVPELCGKAPGEVILGVPESVFRRSAFISGGAMAVDGDAELEKRISALVGSGSEEDEAYSTAREALHARKVKLRHNARVGRAAELERQIAEKEAALAAIEEENRRLGGLYELREAALTEIASLEYELRLHDEAKLRSEYEKTAAAAAARAQAEEELKSIRAKTGGLSGERLAAARMAVSAYREAAAGLRAADSERRRYAEAKAGLARAEAEYMTAVTPARKISPALAVVGVVLMLAGAAGAGAYFALALPLWTVLAAAAAFVLGGVLTVLYFKKRRDAVTENRERLRIAVETAERLVQSLAPSGDITAAVEGEEKAAAELYEALTAIGIDPAAQNIPAAIEEKAALLERLGRAEANFAAAVRLSESLGAPTRLTESTEKLPAPRMERDAARRLLDAARAEGARLERELALSEGELRHLGDPLVLATELENLKTAFAENEEEYEALSLAIAVLDEANAELQQRFSPIVGSLAGKLMAAMTDGAYESISFDRDFSFTAARRGETARSAEYLSTGTSAQLYLAVRLAICLLALPEGEKCPIILDDALLGFDDKRAKAALELLHELSKERQVILFTCQSREKMLLDT